MFCIVKHAKYPEWTYYWAVNPAYGVEETCSAFGTYSAEMTNIQHVYKTYEEALPDLKKTNEFNPSGYYAICPILDKVTTRKDG